MTSTRIYFHVAPVAGRMHVFASLEWPQGEPPARFVVDGCVFMRVEEKNLEDKEREHE